MLTLAALPYGLLAVAISYVGRAYLTLPMQILLLRRASGIRPSDTLNAVAAPLAASTVMGVALAVAMRLVQDRLSAWEALILLTAFGSLLYGVLLLVMSPPSRERFGSLFTRIRKSRI